MGKETAIEWTDATWHSKSAAARIGVSVQVYLKRRRAGLKWCTKCRDWRPLALFPIDRSRGDGLASKCIPSRAIPPLTKEQRRHRANRTYRLYYASQGGARIRAQKIARRRGCEPVNPRDRELAFNHFLGRCAYCGKNADTIDHAIPVSRQGGSHRGNLLPACASCNSRKRAKTVDEFLEHCPSADTARIADELVMEHVL